MESPFLNQQGKERFLDHTTGIKEKIAMSGDFGKSGVKYILEQAKNYNGEIGSYQVHAVDPETFNYVIKLSNGRISITWEELQERYYLTEEGMRSIAGRFIRYQPGC